MSATIYKYNYSSYIVADSPPEVFLWCGDRR
jgi:hypothetical protein